MNPSLSIRMASISDAAALLSLYRPYVEQTAITFEYTSPSLEEFSSRIAHTLERYPYLVGEVNGAIIGYAYVAPFKERAAYDWAVETSIYLKMGLTGHGYGRALYQALEQILQRQNILNLNACIAYTSCEDAHLTNGSACFHERLGYRLVGTFHQCGYKFGTWYDMIWMEKMIGPHSAAPAPVLPITQVDCSDLLKSKPLAKECVAQPPERAALAGAPGG